MTGSNRGRRTVESMPRSVWSAILLAIATGVLLTPATVEGQAIRLHTPSLASPTSGSYIVFFDAQGQPLPPAGGTCPANFVAQWQLPASPSPYGLRLGPSLRYAFVGAAADGPVALSDEAKSALQASGFLDASSNYIAGAIRSPVLSATPRREGRYLLALDSSSKSAIALLEIGVSGGIPTVRSALVKTGASLPADTFGALGAGITIAPDLLRGTVVFGDATTTDALLYSPGTAGNRFSSLDSIPNPSSFHSIAATSAGSPADGPSRPLCPRSSV